MDYDLTVAGDVSGNSFTTTSDERLKSSIEISPYGLSDIPI